MPVTQQNQDILGKVAAVVRKGTVYNSYEHFTRENGELLKEVLAASRSPSQAGPLNVYIKNWALLTNAQDAKTRIDACTASFFQRYIAESSRRLPQPPAPIPVPRRR